MYKIIIEDRELLGATAADLARQLYEFYGFKYATNWFKARKIPVKYHGLITYCELNGQVILDQKEVFYNYMLTIDGVEYKSNHKGSLISEVEYKHDVTGVSSWFDRESVPSSHTHRVSFLKKGDKVIYDNPNPEYKYVMIIDNLEFKFNSRKSLIDALEESIDIVNIGHWIDRGNVPIKYRDRVQLLKIEDRVIYDGSGEKEYAFTMKIDDKEFKSNYKQKLVNEVELTYGLTGVKHWITNKKIPLIYQDVFNYVEFNGEVLFDKSTKKYAFTITIDDKVYQDDIRENLIKKVQDDLGITGVVGWYNRGIVQLKLQDRFSLIKLDDKVIYDANNREYKYSITIDGETLKSNSKAEIVKLVEDKYDVTGVNSWFDRLRLPRMHHYRFKEVIIGDKVIHPKVKRGFE